MGESVVATLAAVRHLFIALLLISACTGVYSAPVVGASARDASTPDEALPHVWVDEVLPAAVVNQHLVIFALSGSSASDVYASGQLGLVMRRAPSDGKWIQLTTPASAARDDFLGLTVPQPGLVFTVGLTDNMLNPAIMASTNQGSGWTSGHPLCSSVYPFGAITSHGDDLWVSRGGDVTSIVHYSVGHFSASACDGAESPPFAGGWAGFWASPATGDVFAAGQGAEQRVVIHLPGKGTTWTDDQLDASGMPFRAAGVGLESISGVDGVGILAGGSNLAKNALYFSDFVHWHALAPPLMGDWHQVLVTHDTLYVGGDGVLASSSDRGQHWIAETCCGDRSGKIRALWASELGDVYAVYSDATASHIFHLQP